MTICPHCKNKGWQDAKTSPLENLGGKKNYVGLSLRRYFCHNCGGGFWTEEKYHSDFVSDVITHQGQKRALTLFDTSQEA